MTLGLRSNGIGHFPHGARKGQNVIERRIKVHVKVDMRNEQVIVRKTVQDIDREKRTSDVKVFGLTDTGHWLFKPEGEKYDDACCLPIYTYRDFDERPPVGEVAFADRLTWDLDGDMVCVKSLDFVDLRVSPCVFIPLNTPLGKLISEDGLAIVPENVLEKIVALMDARQGVAEAESVLASSETEGD